jgi:serine/threonine protein kinase
VNPKKQPILFGKYFLLDRINIGGMAEVWRGKTFGAGGFERLVAIKRILPNIAEDDEFKTMFIDEAKISVQLTHANIAQVHDLGQIGNSLFIAMEYIPGRDMRAIFDRCRKKGEPAPIPLTCYVISKLCDALDYAHRKKDGQGRDMNIVHRDVSPQNVLISFDGEVKVIDFGIAKAAGKATKTQAGILKGKFGYMSPEQIRGLPLDRRSDVFAIGVCLYEMLTGERLFVGDSDFSVLEKVRRADVLPPSTYNRRVPEALERVVLKALAKDVDVRYQYASELFKDLQPFVMMPDVFTQRDLAQYIRSTFVEEVEREKVRLQEYAELKLNPSPPEMTDRARPTREVSAVPAPEWPTPPEPNAGLSGSGSIPPDLARRNSQDSIHLTPVSGVGQAPERDSETQLVPTPVEGQGRRPTDPTFRKGDRGISAALFAPLDTEAPEGAFDADPLGPEPSTKSERSDLADGSATRVGAPSSIGAMDVLPPAAITPTFASSPNALSEEAEASRRALDTEPPDDTSDEGVPPPPPSDINPGFARPALLGRPAIEFHRQPPPPERRPLPQSRWRTVGLGLAGLLLLLCGLALGYSLRLGNRGYLQVELKPALSGKAHLSVNGHDYGTPESWPVVLEISPGPAIVKVTAEGFVPAIQTVDVGDSKRPTVFTATMKRRQEQVPLIVVTDPETAEVRINGKRVRPEGAGGFDPISVTIDTEQLVEASRKGFRSARQSVVPSAPDRPAVVFLKLKPAEFQARIVSSPPGAVIQQGEHVLGQTPTILKFADTTQLTFRHRCYVSRDMAVRPPTDAAELVHLSVDMVHLPGCR